MSNFKEKRKILKLLKEFSKNKSIVYEDAFASFVGQRGLDKYNKDKKNKNIHLNLQELDRYIDDGYIKSTKDDGRHSQLLLTSKGYDILGSNYWPKIIFNSWLTRYIVWGIFCYLMGRLG